MILSIDPGVHIGWAKWSEAGTLIDSGVWEFDELVEFLSNEGGITRVVYEDFILYAHMANGRQTGSRFESSQVIGAIKQFAKRKVPLTRQPAHILRVSAMHAGVKFPKGHVPDRMSAMLHGHYYFMGIKLQPDISAF